MGGIRDTANRMRDISAGSKEAAYGRFFKTLGGLGARKEARRAAGEERGFLAEEAEKERGFRAGETTKKEMFDTASAYRKIRADESAAELLATARAEEIADAYGIGFEQAKELKQMEIDARDAQLRLEAALKSARETDKDLDIITTYNAVMEYAVGGWRGPNWIPELWTEADKERAMRRIEIALGAYSDLGGIEDVRRMAEDDIMGYTITTAPDAAAGEGLPGWTPEQATEGFRRAFAAPIPFTPGETTEGFQRTFGGPGEDTATRINTIRATEPAMRTDPTLWTRMLSLLGSVPSTLDAQTQSDMEKHLDRAEDGMMNKTQLQEFISFLSKIRTPYTGSVRGR